MQVGMVEAAVVDTLMAGDRKVARGEVLLHQPADPGTKVVVTAVRDMVCSFVILLRFLFCI